MKLIKESKIITQQLEAIESLNIVDIKYNTIEHPETSCKLSKTIRQDKNFLGQVLAKNTIDLLTQSKDFKFVTTTVLVFIKIESDNKTKYDTFYSQSKAEALINECDIDNIFQSIYSTIQTGLLIQSQIVILTFQSISSQLVAVISNYQTNQTIQEKVLLTIKMSMIMNNQIE